jgi:hypothetical protein
VSTGEGGPSAEFVLVDVFSALGLALLERLPSERFRLVGRPPAWFLSLFPGAVQELTRSTVRDHSPFLDQFLPVADSFWRNGSDGLLKSGPWLERIEQGQTFRLEATVALIGLRQFLVISAVNRTVDDEASILQRARETALENQSLASRLNATQSLMRDLSADLVESFESIDAFLETAKALTLSIGQRNDLHAATRGAKRMKVLIDVLVRHADLG